MKDDLLVGCSTGVRNQYRLFQKRRRIVLVLWFPQNLRKARDWKPSFKTSFSQSLEDQSHDSCDWWTFHSGDLHVFFTLLLHYTSSALNCSGTVWHMQRNCVAAVSSPQGSFSRLHQCFTTKKREASWRYLLHYLVIIIDGKIATGDH